VCGPAVLQHLCQQVKIDRNDQSWKYCRDLQRPCGILNSEAVDGSIEWEQYPDDVKDNIRELWTTVSARASHLIIFLDQALDALEGDAEKNPSAGGAD
jgi:hypothetical protein